MRQLIRARRWTKVALAVSVVAAAASAGVVVLAPPAHADVLVVTRFDDPVAGACTAGDCSLREAILDANARPDGPHSIQLSAGTYVIELPAGGGADSGHGDFDLSADMTIEGAGSGVGGTVLDARPEPGALPLDRVVQVHSGTVVLEDLRITGGDASASAADFGGGGIAVQPGANVTLRNVAVVDNKAGAVGPVGTNDGGGVRVDQATLTVEDSTIADNDVEHGNVAAGGAIGIMSGGASTVTIEGSTLTGNAATATGDGSVVSGGAISVGDGDLTITDSTLEGNEARTTGGLASEAAGGGISLLAGTVTVERSTMNGNAAIGTTVTATAHGGAIVIAAGSLHVENSTISGNEAGAPAAADGGGINSAAVVDIVHSTVTANQATTGGGFHRTAVAGGFRLRGTLVSDNTGGDCGGTVMTSQGFNLDSDGSCDLGQPTDVPSGEPALQSLADNGGPTRTHALGDGSDAVNEGGSCAGTVAVDQRGVSRPQGSECEIGSFEVEPPPPPTTTTTTTTSTTTTTTIPPTTSTLPTTTTTTEIAPTTTTTLPATMTTTTTTTTAPPPTASPTTTPDSPGPSATDSSDPAVRALTADERERQSQDDGDGRSDAGFEPTRNGESAAQGLESETLRRRSGDGSGKRFLGSTATSLLALAVLGLFLFLFGWRRRRKGEDEDEHEEVQPSQASA